MPSESKFFVMRQISYEISTRSRGEKRSYGIWAFVELCAGQFDAGHQVDLWQSTLFFPRKVVAFNPTTRLSIPAAEIACVRLLQQINLRVFMIEQLLSELMESRSEFRHVVILGQRLSGPIDQSLHFDLQYLVLQ